MNFLQTRAKVVQRSKGRSAVASAAYRSGEKLKDERQGMDFDYSRKDRIKFTSLFLPDGVKAMTRSEFWNGVEKYHKRGDATTAREIEFALPHNFSEKNRLLIAENYGKIFSEKYKVGVDVSVHTSGDGNWHCHMLMSANSISDSGFGKKVVELDPHHCSINKIENPIEFFRKRYEKFLNETYEKNGLSDRVDRRSFEDQGIDKIPTIHIGVGRDKEANKELNERIKIVNSMPQREDSPTPKTAEEKEAEKPSDIKQRKMDEISKKAKTISFEQGSWMVSNIKSLCTTMTSEEFKTVMAYSIGRLPETPTGEELIKASATMLFLRQCVTNRVPLGTALGPQNADYLKVGTHNALVQCLDKIERVFGPEKPATRPSERQRDDDRGR